MKGPFEAVKVSENVYWVGAIDWGTRDFHGYETGRGSTYNAYLITGDDVMLVDTVKAPFKDELMDAGALLVGTPTINNNMFPSVADVLAYTKGLKPQNPMGAALGSYGWSGEGALLVSDVLAGMKVELVDDVLKVRYVPEDDALAGCRSPGEAVAKRLKEVVKGG